MAGLTLYTNPMSRGRIARWMLEEVGADYAVEVLGYGSTMKADSYLAINPMGKVPAIVHDGRVVTECAAICAYLADAFPDAGLAPTAAERADYYRWMFFAAGPLEQAITNRSLGVVPSDDQQRMVGYGDYDRVVTVLEAAVAAHPYIAGDRFTAADVYVGSHVMWGTQFGTLPKLDAFTAYLGRLLDRPAYARASALDDAAVAEMQAA
ncbi:MULTISPECIES: glutathione S-transferase family protein [unclassified Sphingomonas]|uniref:glutathione S-transferase family protein n=1 Tax=unclassified Sphingomonas TaxID=196159 RepID=UPI0006F4604A|nr:MULTISPECIES: glutathione S-transferase family protein [unclassified Sphingomonas]KQM28067.1 glutathione S-transferase [Sphingomonas sp. Leaf9]KQM44409.1 glutathione S-transferase [Sphingomonas sp. Leaf11]